VCGVHRASGSSAEAGSVGVGSDNKSACIDDLEELIEEIWRGKAEGERSGLRSERRMPSRSRCAPDVTPLFLPQLEPRRTQPRAHEDGVTRVGASALARSLLTRTHLPYRCTPPPPHAHPSPHRDPLPHLPAPAPAYRRPRAYLSMSASTSRTGPKVSPPCGPVPSWLSRLLPLAPTMASISERPVSSTLLGSGAWARLFRRLEGPAFSHRHAASSRRIAPLRNCA
jgi:hypothetical protein